MDSMIIDVREPHEFFGDHVTGAINIPLRRLEENIQSMNVARSTPIVVYCRSGNRSGVAQQLLRDMGFTNVTNGINKQRVEEIA